MKPEQKLYQLIKEHIPGDVQRIESVVGVGIPDVNFCFNGRERWIENKAVDRYVSNSITYNTLDWLLSPSQLAWHAKRLKVGGTIFVCNRAFDSIYLWIKRAQGYELVFIQNKPWDWDAFTLILETY